MPGPNKNYNRLEIDELIDGSGTSHTGELADLSDTGAEIAADTATASGDGTTVTFTLSHSLGSTPTAVSVVATSSDASANFYVSSKGSSSVDVMYNAAPASGTNNLSWDIITRA